MSKQLITLLGVLVTAGILVLGVALGVLPLVGGVFTAYGQRQQVARTNGVYEVQIAALTQQKENLDEIESSVDALRDRIPAEARLDEVFERIALAAEGSGVRVTAVNREDEEPYVARTGTGEDPAPAPVATQPQAEGTSAGAVDPTAPIDAAQGVADSANGQPGASAPSPADGSARLQVPISIRVIAPDIASAHAFIDGLRAGPRAIAIDKATVTQNTSGFDVQVTALAFIQSDGQTDGGE